MDERSVFAPLIAPACSAVSIYWYGSRCGFFVNLLILVWQDVGVVGRGGGASGVLVSTHFLGQLLFAIFLHVCQGCCVALFFCFLHAFSVYFIWWR